MSPAPPLPATPVNDSHRILAPRPGFGHSAVGFQYPSRLARSAQAPPLAFPRISPPRFRAAVSATREIRPAQSLLPAQRSHIPSTTRLLGNQLSPLRPCLLFVWLCLNIAMRHNLSQDAVRLALTIIAATTGNGTNCSPAHARIQVPRMF